MPTTRHALVAALLAALLWGCSGGGGSDLPVASPDTVAVPAPAPPPRQRPAGQGGLDGRLVVGYQGWFGCPGDFEDNPHWVHWFLGPPSAQTLLVDMLPATAGLAAEDLCDTGLRRRDGTPLRVYSSQNPNVVDWHFGLMARQQVGAVALQRFVVELVDPAHRRRVDNVLRHVVRASQRHGLPFYLTYDISGADAATVVQTIRDDWRALAGWLDLTAQGNYLQDSGKPVLQLWGFGFSHTPGRADEALRLLADLRAGDDGLRSVTLVGGVPSQWRTLQGDAKPGAGWAEVYLAFDVLSPWTVGRFADAAGAQQHFDGVTIPDLALLRTHGLRYQPVMFPGFSHRNLMLALDRPERAIANEIPRDCGRFIWNQSHRLLDAGIRLGYVAMFDEFDEGTAMLPAAPTQDGFPADASGVALDQDGCALPADWYLGMLGRMASHFRDGTLPAMPLR